MHFIDERVKNITEFKRPITNIGQKLSPDYYTITQLPLPQSNTPPFDLHGDSGKRVQRRQHGKETQ